MIVVAPSMKFDFTKCLHVAPYSLFGIRQRSQNEISTRSFPPLVLSCSVNLRSPLAGLVGGPIWSAAYSAPSR